MRGCLMVFDEDERFFDTLNLGSVPEISDAEIKRDFGGLLKILKHIDVTEFNGFAKSDETGTRYSVFFNKDTGLLEVQVGSMSDFKPAKVIDYKLNKDYLDVNFLFSNDVINLHFPRDVDNCAYMEINGKSYIVDSF